MPTLSRLAVAYVAERRSRPGGYTKTTARHVRHKLLRLAADLGDPEIRQLTCRRLQHWLDERHVAPSTARNDLSVLRAFCRWCVRNGYLRANPTLDMDPIAEPRRVPRGLPAAAVAGIHDACPDARAALIVSLAVQEGLRVAEIAGLELGDIDFDLRIMLVTGKGGHERVLPITVETWDALGVYLAERPARVGPLIRSYLDGRRPISAGHVSRLVAGWMRAAKVKKGAWDGTSAHSLRHTAATDALRNGAHPRDVQAMLGHATLATTERYLPWLVDADGGLRRAMGGRRYRLKPAADPSDAGTG